MDMRLISMGVVPAKLDFHAFNNTPAKFHAAFI